MPAPDPHTMPSSPETLYGDPEDVGMLTRMKSWFIALRRYWWVCIPTILLGGYYKYAQVADTPTRWSSRAEMMLMGQLNIPDSNYYQEVYLNFFGTQTNLMESAEVKERARARVISLHPDLAEVAGDVNIRATHREGSNMFDLYATGSDEKYVQLYLNAAMEAYLNFRQENRTSRTEATLSQINAEIIRLDGEIQKQEEALQDFQSKNNMVFIREQAASAANYMVNLNRTLADLNNDLQLIELYVSQRNAQDETASTLDSNNVSIDELLSKESEFVQTRQRLRAFKAERERFAQVLRPVHPKMKRFDNEIKQLEIVLEVQRKQGIQELSRRRQNLMIRIENLENTIAEWEERSVELSRKLAGFERINNKLDRLKKLYDQRVASLQVIDSARKVTLEPISIVKRATSASPIKPNLMKETRNGAVSGLVVGLVLIGVIRVMRAIVYTEHDLPFHQQIRTVAYIPRIPGKRGRMALIESDDKRYAFLEAFRNLRSYILMEFSNKTRKQATVISVTSAIPSEGKSTVSSNLALSFAYAGHKVLLIDADMRQGTQHKAFGLENNRGLTELLQQQCTIEDTILRGNQSGLHVLPRGSAMMNSSELLLTEACSKLYAYAKEHYEYVIIDTPPVMATDDVANIINNIDAVLIVARMSLSNRRALENAINMLHNRRARIGGFVLNSCDASSTDYYRYKYYGYYGKADEANR